MSPARAGRGGADGRPDRTCLLLAAHGAAVAVAASAALRHRPPGGAGRWERSNFRGRTLTLLAGPAAVAGAMAPLAVGDRAGVAPAAVLGAVAATVGLYDDLAGGAHARGFRGHLAALRRGRVTSGLVKLAVIVAAAVAASAADERAESAGRRQRAWEVLVRAGLTAGCANLVNLFDVRPGRAVKVVVLIAAPLTVAGGPAGRVAAGPLGAALALAPADLREQAMLGDTGANTLGALLGHALGRTRSARRRHAALLTVLTLTAASEVMSFSRVIDAVPVLRRIDRLGTSP